jgi:hypothetical protein
MSHLVLGGAFWGASHIKSPTLNGAEQADRHICVSVISVSKFEFEAFRQLIFCEGPWHSRSHQFVWMFVAVNIRNLLNVRCRCHECPL